MATLAAMVWWVSSCTSAVTIRSCADWKSSLFSFSDSLALPLLVEALLVLVDQRLGHGGARLVVVVPGLRASPNSNAGQLREGDRAAAPVDAPGDRRRPAAARRRGSAPRRSASPPRPRPARARAAAIFTSNAAARYCSTEKRSENDPLAQGGLDPVVAEARPLADRDVEREAAVAGQRRRSWRASPRRADRAR